jgi:hypothetical protein
MTTKTYLTTYPIEWPIFSVKYYSKDSDGWWNPIKRTRRTKFEINLNTSLQ